MAKLFYTSVWRRAACAILLGLGALSLTACEHHHGYDRDHYERINVVDERGLHHEGYYDEHHDWHGGYYDERRTFHEDPHDWRHDERHDNRN